MRKRVLLLALTSVLMSLCIPACAQYIHSDSIQVFSDEEIAKIKSYEMTIKERVKKDKTISDCYVIEIGAISDQNRARPAYREEFTKKSYQVPEGITVKELILSLPGIKRNILGRLAAKKSKKTIRCIHFNSQWVSEDNIDHLYYTNDTKLKITPYFHESPCRIYDEDTKLNKGTAFVKIKRKSSSRRCHGADIVIEYYQDVPYDKVGGNSDYADLGLSVKWATRNVGAAGPEEIGDFYFWDETETKLDGSWRMPTSDEITELIENCTWTWASVNGEIGFLITSNKPGYTDRSIFLPYYYGGTSGDVGYWSGSFNANSNDIDATACLWICFDGHIRSGYCYRHWELPVRPVYPSVSLTQLPAELIEKVKAYDNYYYKLEKGEYVIEIEPISDKTGEKPKAYDNYYYKLEKGEYVIEIEPISDETGAKPEYREYPDGVKTSIIPVGTTVKELLSMLPDVETDKDGKLITKNANEVVTSIVFDDQMLYPQNNNPIYTDDYKLEKGILHIQIIDLDYFKERSWSPMPGDPTEGTARIRINYHPGKDASFIIRHSPDDTRQTGH